MKQASYALELITSDGVRHILVSKPVAQEGEGRIHEIVGCPDFLAKIYTRPETAGRSDKLRAMASQVTHEPLKVAAWPTATLHERRGGPVVGFTMPRITGYRELHHLYSVSQRRKDFPRADFGFLVHAAINCAIAFETIHERGHVIGDVNQKNVLVSDQALIKLVDCDSFQIRAADGRIFRCDVGVPEFTPPELQDRSFRTFNRDVNHDRSGLAILLFQILMMGRHPFSGRFRGAGELTLERAIKEGRYAYSTKSHSLHIEPPPNSLPISLIGASITELFERAFLTRGVDSAPDRPGATEWKDRLLAFQRSLAKCKYFACHSFPVNLGTCPWCMIQSNEGIFFFSLVGTGAKDENIRAMLKSLLGEFRQLRIPAFNYVAPQPQAWGPRVTGRPLPANLSRPSSQPVLTYPPRQSPQALNLPPAPAPPPPPAEPLVLPVKPPPPSPTPLALPPPPAPPATLVLELPPKPAPPAVLPIHLPPRRPYREKLQVPPFVEPTDDRFLQTIAFAASVVGLFVILFALLPGVLCFVGFGMWGLAIHFSRPLRARAFRRRFEKQRVLIEAENERIREERERSHEEIIREVRENHQRWEMERANAYSEAMREYERTLGSLRADHRRRQEERRRIYEQRLKAYEETVRPSREDHRAREMRRQKAYEQTIREYETQVEVLREDHRRREEKRARAHEERVREYDTRVEPLRQQHRTREAERLKAYEAECREKERQYQDQLQTWEQQVASWRTEHERRERAKVDAVRSLGEAENEWRTKGSRLCGAIQREYDTVNRDIAHIKAGCDACDEKLARLMDTARQAQLHAHLDTHLIRDQRGTVKGLT